MEYRRENEGTGVRAGASGRRGLPRVLGTRASTIWVAGALFMACAGHRPPDPGASVTGVVEAGSTPVPEPEQREHRDPQKPVALPFHYNDYQAARQEAVARHVPIFAEVWAKW